MEQADDITFSFICPVYNEQEGLEHFYNRLKAVADSLGEPYEIIFTNDGSSDGTDGVLERLAQADEHVKAVEFSRNFGHQVAVTAGYDFARGKAVISLDADCQHPPEMIPQLVARWREGYEVVYTVRQDTKGISSLRRMIGRLTYRVIRASSGVELTDQADFRLMDRKAVDALCATREHARFVRGLVHWIGFRQIGVPYTAERRQAGKSVYTLRQLIGMSTAGVYNFSDRPLKLAPAIGAALLASAVIYALVAVVMAFFAHAPSAYWHVIMAMVGLFGVQFLMLGILGQYVSRIFDEAKGRPLYVVRRTMGFDRAGNKDEKPQASKTSAPQARTFSVYT